MSISAMTAPLALTMQVNITSIVGSRYFKICCVTKKLGNGIDGRSPRL